MEVWQKCFDRRNAGFVVLAKNSSVALRRLLPIGGIARVASWLYFVDCWRLYLALADL